VCPKSGQVTARRITWQQQPPCVVPTAPKYKFEAALHMRFDIFLIIHEPTSIVDHIRMIFTSRKSILRTFSTRVTEPVFIPHFGVSQTGPESEWGSASPVISF